MRRYRVAFRMAVTETLTYRLNFLLGRVRNIILLVLLYSVWTTLTQTTDRFATYSQEELLTYIIGVHLLKTLLMDGYMRRLAEQINDGTFSIYLVAPINPFWFLYARELGHRTVVFVTSLVEITAFMLLLDVSIVLAPALPTIVIVVLALFLAHILYYLMSFLMSLLAFWSREAMGPWFLFDWFFSFASGIFFPLDVLSRSWFLFLSMLPFAFVFFVPVEMYLGRLTTSGMFLALMTQLLWIAGIGWLTRTTWSRGLKRYTGEGI